ncbi:prepilin-type N-terminal cleavage/methylation domain-containing protein [Noviherbaspirillum galbum]|uniref:Type IV pilus modification protein PilV n=1 Tax=Noviherbaspirillum galbum TaxID=2709383 RepID=A0A6B3SI08_9BURK|nr:prepilin-type N-terminal cleavage/methylation domain-containing protein [Noviherbaspirillum galbum]NEX60290.1 type IV pilus modification protein PilV [Noviherbaspirillum galbum]
MLSRIPYQGRRERGITMIEVLVTIVILAFGMLGLAGLQNKVNIGMLEAYQRGQAVILLNDMAERIKAMPMIPCRNVKALGSTTRCDQFSTTVNASYTSAVAVVRDYATGSALGTGDSPASDCSTLTNQAQRDKCEWSKALQGAGETTGGANAQKVGAMNGARGCITEISAPNGTNGACTAGVYQITVSWQGMHATQAPSLTCGSGQYGAENMRRSIATRVSIPVPNC